MLPILLTGCNVVIDEATFFDEYPEQMCQRGITCLWPDMPPDVETCVEERQAILEDRANRCGEFDKDAAASCLRTVRDLSCDDTEYRFPDADPGDCAYVYPCAYTSTIYYTSDTGF